MRNVMLLARRELSSYLGSMFGWVIIALLLFIAGLLFNAGAMAGEKASSEVVRQFFIYTAGVIIAGGVISSMRTFAAEREQRTLVLLRTSPVSEWELVLGKYLGTYAYVLLLTAFTVYMPLLVLVNGNLVMGQIAAGYFGLALVAAAATAIGVFGSSVSKTQVLAVALSAVIAIMLYLLTLLSAVTDPPLDGFFGFLGLLDGHMYKFAEGGVHLRSIIYYLSLAFLFLLASVRVLEARRWR